MNKKLAFSLIELSIVILIIGILVAGVTQSSRLVAQMRLASAQSVTRSADISSIRDMVFWAE
ncbi:MAG: prepilin-type N-terminal cleavage/methylation domain-containing protein, partial [Bacteroidota bacterium]